MKSYHIAWLDAHPDRTAEWLKRMLKEGFQVHHIDGDHGNDHPGNLALIETVDHMRLHGIFRLVRCDTMRKAHKARWQATSPEQRSEHARNMANIRWKRVRRANKAKRAAAARRAAMDAKVVVGASA